MAEETNSVFGFGAIAAILFGTSVDATLTIFGATNSSPQTTHIFAKDRSTTLMWYVRAGLIGTIIVIAIMAAGAYKSGGAKLAAWPIMGGVISGGGMWWLYKHALKEGSGDNQSQGKQEGSFAYGAY